jgi:sarcosine oxidase subunit gamma
MTGSFIARSPYASNAGAAGVAEASNGTRGVVAAERDGLGIATVLARAGQIATLERRCREDFGIDLPREPRRAVSNDLSIAGTGPEAWLAIRERGGNAFASSLASALDGCASVSDQSDSYAVLRLNGPKVRQTLAKLVPIDVHDRAFPVGAVAGTVAAHMGALLWRLDDEEGTAVFELAVFRSMAGSLWHALASCAAEFGLVLDDRH